MLDLTEPQARGQLIANNLQVEVKKVNGDEETKGTITAQDPVADTEVDVNSTVTITLNEGPKTGTIPDGLVGEDVKDVENTLDDLKFSNVNTVAAKTRGPRHPARRGDQHLTEGGLRPCRWTQDHREYATGKSRSRTSRV